MKDPVIAWEEFDRLVIGAALANVARALKLLLRPKADTLNTPCSLILFRYKNQIKLKFIIDKCHLKIILKVLDDFVPSVTLAFLRK